MHIGERSGRIRRNDMVEGLHLCGLLQHHWTKGWGQLHVMHQKHSKTLSYPADKLIIALTGKIWLFMFQIRCYPKNTKLDNTFAVTTKVPSQILLLNTFRDILIIFCIDSHVMLFNMERKNSQKSKRIVEKLNIAVSHCYCKTSVG